MNARFDGEFFVDPAHMPSGGETERAIAPAVAKMAEDYFRSTMEISPPSMTIWRGKVSVRLDGFSKEAGGGPVISAPLDELAADILDGFEKHDCDPSAVADIKATISALRAAADRIEQDLERISG